MQNFMDYIVHMSGYIIPAIFLMSIYMGFTGKTPVYENFVKGAASGLTVVKDIMPTLIGLMTGVGMLRASGVLDAIAGILKPVADIFHFPVEAVPAAIVRLFSSSAATGLALDIFEKAGPDSYVGRVISIMFSSTETVFYTMSVYFMAAKVTKTKWTLTGALLSNLSGLVASSCLAALM